MASLTKKQKKVIDFIRDFINRRGYSPSVEEITNGVGLSSKATVHVHLKNLYEKGFIKMSPGRARSVELPAEDKISTPNSTDVPLLGLISAGRPIDAVSNPETISLPAEFVGRGETFVLRVRGDSMIDDHILDGDYVIVEKRDAAEAGETVVALIDGFEATIKRFYQADDGSVRLEPRNPSMAPMEFPADRVTIQGVVVGILRRMKRAY